VWGKTLGVLEVCGNGKVFGVDFHALVKFLIELWNLQAFLFLALCSVLGVDRSEVSLHLL
jgi:hypothetical protein